MTSITHGMATETMRLQLAKVVSLGQAVAANTDAIYDQLSALYLVGPSYSQIDAQAQLAVQAGRAFAATCEDAVSTVRAQILEQERASTWVEPLRPHVHTAGPT